MKKASIKEIKLSDGSYVYAVSIPRPVIHVDDYDSAEKLATMLNDVDLDITK